MSNTYRFITSDTLTGRILADSLPLVGQTASRQINQIGSFNGYLPLIFDDGDFRQGMVNYWVNALTPWKSILWILQDDVPIWSGPITGWPHQSITDGQLPIQAASMENFFKYRIVTKQLAYNNVDIFDIFKAEMNYALAKQPNGFISATGRYAGKSGIIDTVAKSGQIGSITETAGFQSIYDCWNDLVTSYGLEYALTPAKTDTGNLYNYVQLGLPQMGRLWANTRLQLMIPAEGSVNYSWQWVPSNPVNRMVVTGSGTARVPVIHRKPVITPPTFKTVPRNYQATATATQELAAGFPLLEGNSSFFGTVTSQGQINNYAKNLLFTSTIQKSLTPTFTVMAEGEPQIHQIQLGDEAMVIATSPLHPMPDNGGPGITKLFRITGWTLTFPNAQQAETTQYQLGDILVGGL